jgi:ParB-like chromosome segregation protein Spo0J
MASSIREFGLKIAIPTRRDREVIDWHLRLKAAQKLNLESAGHLLP